MFFKCCKDNDVHDISVIDILISKSNRLHVDKKFTPAEKKYYAMKIDRAINAIKSDGTLSDLQINDIKDCFSIDGVEELEKVNDLLTRRCSI